MLPLPDTISPLDRYRLVRSRIEHEDSLIVQRLAWLVASQSFLFTAYAIVLNGLGGPAGPARVGVPRERLLALVPVVGVTTSGLIYVSILAGIRALRGLSAWYRTQDLDPALPWINTPGLTPWAGLAAPLVLPVVFIVVWLMLWVR